MRKSLGKSTKENAKIIVAEEKAKSGGGWCTTLVKENPAVTAFKQLSGRKRVKAGAGSINDFLD